MKKIIRKISSVVIYSPDIEYNAFGKYDGTATLERTRYE